MMTQTRRALILLMFLGVGLSCASKTSVEPAKPEEPQVLETPAEESIPVPPLEPTVNQGPTAFEEVPTPKPVKRTARRKRPAPTPTAVVPEVPQEQPTVAREIPTATPAPALVITATPKTDTQGSSLLKGPLGLAAIALAALVVIIVVVGSIRSKRNRL